MTHTVYVSVKQKCPHFVKATAELCIRSDACLEHDKSQTNQMNEDENKCKLNWNELKIDSMFSNNSKMLSSKLNQK